MRKVMVSKKQPNGNYELEEIGEALFHIFGVNYEEFKSGPGNFSTAIIEWPDGTIENVPVNTVRFLDIPLFLTENDILKKDDESLRARKEIERQERIIDMKNETIEIAEIKLREKQLWGKK